MEEKINESTAYYCATCGERAEHEEMEADPNMKCPNCGDSDWTTEEPHEEGDECGSECGESMYIKSFESWSMEKDQQEKIMEAEIPWATEETNKILEGRISDLDILAKEAQSFEDFVKSFEKYAAENSIAVKVDDEETEKWLKTIYDDSKKDSE